MITRTLAAITYAATLLALIGGAQTNVPLFAYPGIVAALAALAWGYLKHGEYRRGLDDLRAREAVREFEARAHGPYTRADLADMQNRSWRPVSYMPDEDELPYRPVDHAPCWDTDTFGAPE